MERFDVHVVAAFQVQPRLQGQGGSRLPLFHVMVVIDDAADGAAVGNHIAVKAPFIPQERRQQPRVRRAGNAVHRIVGRHDGLRMPPPYAGLEGRQIVLAELLLADDGVALEAVVFLVVRREMLGRGDYFQITGIVALQAPHEGGAVFAGQERIFPVGLGRTAPAGIPRHIHRRRPEGQEVAVLGRLFLPALQLVPPGPRLIGNHAGNALQQGGIPHCGKRDGLRENREIPGTDNPVQRLVPVIVLVDAHPRNARGCRPEQVDLLVERQRFQQGLHPVADGEGFILPGFGLREGRKRRGQKGRQNRQFSHHHSVTRLNTGILSRSTGTSA